MRQRRLGGAAGARRPRPHPPPALLGSLAARSHTPSPSPCPPARAQRGRTLKGRSSWTASARKASSIQAQSFHTRSGSACGQGGRAAGVRGGWQPEASIGGHAADAVLAWLGTAARSVREHGCPLLQAAWIDRPLQSARTRSASTTHLVVAGHSRVAGRRAQGQAAVLPAGARAGGRAGRWAASRAGEAGCGRRAREGTGHPAQGCSGPGTPAAWYAAGRHTQLPHRG